MYNRIFLRVPAVYNRRAVIKGIIGADLLSHQQQGVSKLRDPMVWPSGIVELFDGSIFTILF